MRPGLPTRKLVFQTVSLPICTIIVAQHSMQYTRGSQTWIHVPLGVHLRLAIEGKNVYILFISNYLHIYLLILFSKIICLLAGFFKAF